MHLYATPGTRHSHNTTMRVALRKEQPVDPARHEFDMEIKAITYHGLKVERDGDGWLAEVIVDL